MEILYIMYFGCFKYVHSVWGHKIDLTKYVHTLFPNPDQNSQHLSMTLSSDRFC